MVMNKIYYVLMILALLMTGGLCGCEDFLEESSQDEMRPSSVDDLKELMMGVVYPAGVSFHNYLELMTDDAESSFTNLELAITAIKRYEGPFTWQKNMYELMESNGLGSSVKTYEHYFSRIMGCNTVLDQLDKVKGEEDDKLNVRGQALAMRAWFYFMLVNLYGQPYNAEGVDIEKTPGLPLLISSTVKDDPLPQVSVARIYQQVEEDLLEALPMLEKYGKENSKYKVTDMFVYTLLSRMYLYMEKWEKAEEYASKALEKNSELINLARYADGGVFTDGVYGLNSPEAIWYGYGNDNEYESYDWSGFWRYRSYWASAELRELYDYQDDTWDRKDLRYLFYFSWAPVQSIYPNKGITWGEKKSGSSALSSQCVKGMRVAELYLNRAEAYIHMGDEKLALDDLNELRRHRYDTRNVAYQPVSNLTGENLLQFCRDERRRELNFEDHRWFDLRRYGMPRIEHVFRSDVDQVPQVFVLEKGDPRYVFAIPDYILTRNPALVPNP